MNQLVPSSANEVRAPEGGEVARAVDRSTFVPRVDTLEHSDELRMYVDLPGVTAETLDVRFENGELTIHGRIPDSQQENSESPSSHSWLSEYPIGDYHRTFTLDESIDADQIEAELKDGVLTIRLPKVERVKPRRIEVTAG